MRQEPLKLKGAPGSPYTRKMLAYMRYRHIRYELLIGDQATTDYDLPSPKVELLPTFYLPNDEGEIEAVVDSTPLIRRFESDFSGRPVLPADPAINFINYLIEDYADEWLTKAMFHYRWYYDADIKKAGSVLPLWRSMQVSDKEMQRAAEYVSNRQISRLYVVGSNDITAPVIEDSYRRFLDIMENLLQRQHFVLGNRPSSADFAIYAQLTQLAKFDPTPAKIALERAPRVFAWVDVIDDLSGQPDSGDWQVADEVKESLTDLLTEVGRVYVPALLANAEALAASSNQMRTTIDGRDWQQPAFPYQAKCLQWINEEYQKLEKVSQAQVDGLLAGTGCEMLIL